MLNTSAMEIPQGALSFQHDIANCLQNKHKQDF